MAWQDEMTTLLRVFVQDIAGAKYPDSSLQLTLLGAAQLVRSDGLSFTQNFRADLVNQDLSPDPTDADAGTRDDDFVNLVCMRAAAIIDQGLVRSESGIVIRDNGSMVDLHYKLQAALELVKSKGGWLNLYEEAKLIYQNGSVTDGMMVIGPIRDFARGYWGRGTDDYYSPRTGDYWS